MGSEPDPIVSLLNRAFSGQAWHGPSVRESLEGISEQQALSRIPGTHSIIEIVWHMIAWRRYVVKMLQGDHDYRVTDDLNFRVSGNWRRTLTELENSQGELQQAIATIPPAQLQQQVPWTEENFTYHHVLHGIIHHDLYHTGQIMLIRKSMPQQTI